MNDKDFFVFMSLRVYFCLYLMRNCKYLHFCHPFEVFRWGKVFRNVNGMRDILKVYRNWRGIQFAVSTLDKSSRVNINV